MADLYHEGLIKLAEAAVLEGMPKRHLTTWIRWATEGCREVTLETMRVGGTLYTSKPAVLRFFERLSGPITPTPVSKPAKGHERAGKHLDSIGL